MHQTSFFKKIQQSIFLQVHFTSVENIVQTGCNHLFPQPTQLKQQNSVSIANEKKTQKNKTTNLTKVLMKTRSQINR